MTRLGPLLACFLTLFCLQQAQARIGETEKQIIARYGKAQKPLPSLGPRDKCAIFIFHGFKITVTFLDGISQDEEFNKLPDAQFTEAEFTTLLSANAPLASWVLREPNSSPGREWHAHTEQHEIIATYSKTGSGYDLQIGTDTFIRYISDQMVQKDKARLEGF